MMEKPILIVGAGMAGLAAAIRLAAAGRRVIVLEQNAQVGGKMAEYRQAGYRWDTGPSLITMRPAFEELFHSAGRRLEDYLDLQPVEPITRCIYPDGTRLDLGRELPGMLEQIGRLGGGVWPEDVEGYQAFLSYAARLYRITSPIFIFDQPPTWRSLLRVRPWDALRFDGLRTMDQAVSGFVRSPYLRQMLDMFATYVGASPYRAPATLNVIAHVELSQGVWYPQGGVYAIARAYERLAQELGVEIRTGSRVSRIDVRDGIVQGVSLQNGEFLAGSAVIANLDVALVYETLLAGWSPAAARARDLSRREPSCSAFVLLLGVRGESPDLAHHNELFSGDYPAEFRQIFDEGRPPGDPTIYLSITSKTTLQDAPPGCENWFVQVNVPAMQEGWDWSRQASGYTEQVLEGLARRGYDIRDRIEVCRVLTPQDLAKTTGARGGALYGASSNSRWAAFRRPHNRAAGLQGLYFAGGTTHPGGGVPMATLSGKVASQMVVNDGY